MNYDENFENLEILTKISKNDVYHSFSDEFRLLPFQTREPDRPKFTNGFKSILGEFSRLVCNKDWDKEITNDFIIEKIINCEDIDCDAEDKNYLNILLKDYLITENNEINIIHPYLYLYVSKTLNKSSKGEVMISRFLKDVMFKDISEIIDYFKYTDDTSKNNILLKLILNNLPELPDKKTEAIFTPKLNYVTSIFKKDIKLAIQHEKFFSDNIENILAYYYFFYITQLSLKISDLDSDIDNISEIYYLFDAESISKNRKTINIGYNLIKNNNKNLLSKIYTIDYINKILGTKGLLYKEIIDYVENLNSNDQNKIINLINQFNLDYIRIKKLKIDFNNPTDIRNSVLSLYKTLQSKNAVDEATKSRYSLCLEKIGLEYFLKRKGRYGYVLNITQEMLLTITALCIDQDKMKLKQLFYEYEKRGLFFDKITKIKIEKLLTKLNLIDKKSDSGDAQYVKRIL